MINKILCFFGRHEYLTFHTYVPGFLGFGSSGIVKILKCKHCGARK